MMRAKIIRDVDAQWWDSLARSAQGEFHQSMAYSSFCIECVRKRPYYLIVEENSTVLGLASFFAEGHGQDFFTVNFPLSLSRIPAALLRTMWKNCSLLHGPLILDREREADILDRVVQELERFARAEKIFRWKKIMPPLHYGQFNREIWDTVFAQHGFDHKTWGTFLVDLSGGEEAIWKHLKPSARNKIRKVRKQGMECVQVQGDEGFEKYYQLLSETRARKGFAIGARPDLLRQWWRKNQETLQFFMVEKDGKPVAGQGVFLFNGIMREFFVGTSDYAIENKLYGGDLLKFEGFVWGAEHGYHMYDLAGVHPNPETSAEKFIREFKGKWGGAYVEFPIYSKLYNVKRQQALDRVKGLLHRMRQAKTPQ